MAAFPTARRAQSCHTWLPLRRRKRSSPRSTCALNWSGWRDSNSRPPAPKAGALTKLRYIPKATEAYLVRRHGRRGLRARRSPVVQRFAPGHRTRGSVMLSCGSAAANPRDASAAAKPVRYGIAARPRGRSSMVEPQPSKLVMRVRFPSPALSVPAQVMGMIIGFLKNLHEARFRPRARCVPDGSSLPAPPSVVALRRACRSSLPMPAAIASSRSWVACW